MKRINDTQAKIKSGELKIKRNVYVNRKGRQGREEMGMFALRATNREGERRAKVKPVAHLPVCNKLSLFLRLSQ
jgi:hypothetical protein